MNKGKTMEDNIIFTRKLDDYNIMLNPKKDYATQATKFITKRTGMSKDRAKQLLRKIIKESGAKDPVVKFKNKQDNGDIVLENTTLSEYIKDSLDNGEVIVPSFTTYVHPSKRKSVHAEFLKINIGLRKSDKKAAQMYKQAGKTELSNYYNTLQKVRKIFNNSLSGAYASKSTILYNPSAHYTLTSMTRSVSGIGNAITEYMVSGNKHFKRPEDIYNYITSVITMVRSSGIEYLFHKYNLAVPTVDEIMYSFLRSSKLYWTDVVMEDRIRKYVETLNDTERGAVMYVNDLYHLRKLNPEFVRNILTKLAKRVTTGSTDHLNDIYKAPEGVVNLVMHICAEDVIGKDIKFDELVGTSLLEIIASTSKHVTETLREFKILFQTLFSTDVLPQGVAHIKDMYRDCIVLSDTDSTCGSYDEWVHWYFGKHRFDQPSIALSAAVMTITTQAMDHNLKVFAKNMNIDNKLVELIKMKNEFYWPIFIPTNVSKHYFAEAAIVEGNVLPKTESEIKGVHLLASAANQKIVAKAHATMTEISDTITSGKKLNPIDFITRVMALESELLNKINRGDTDIYKRDKIKAAASYKLDPHMSPYLHHMLWEEVFEPKYGRSDIPEYAVTKVSTTLSSKRKMSEYLESLEDQQLADRLKAFLKKHKKETLGTFRVPVSIVADNGIPPEILQAVDSKRIITDNMNVFYLILESIGLYRKRDMLFIEMGYDHLQANKEL